MKIEHPKLPPGLIHRENLSARGSHMCSSYLSSRPKIEPVGVLSAGLEVGARQTAKL